MSKSIVSSVGHRWEEVEKELFTPEEIAASELRVAIIGEVIKARNEIGISQKKVGRIEWCEAADYSQNGKGYYKSST